MGGLRDSAPSAEILPVSAFLDEKLQLRAANSSEISFDGVVLLDFGLEKGSVEFSVPVLRPNLRIQCN